MVEQTIIPHFGKTSWLEVHAEVAGQANSVQLLHTGQTLTCDTVYLPKSRV